MAAKTVIVTGADHRYAPLMREMIASVRRQPSLDGIDLAVLDCGLNADDRDWCREQGAQILEPDWDVAFGPNLNAPSSFRAMTARPHLRKYFPGYETYVWLDADVWVQDASAVELLRTSAALGDIALVPEVHRSYRNFRDGRNEFEAANGAAYAECFGAESAARLIRRPLNNAGVFAIGASSPLWNVWAELLADVAQRSANMIDQIALNYAIYERGIHEVRLPATCNWIAHLATPAWDEEKALFVDPDPPHDTIGILHLTLGTKWAPATDVPLAGTRRPPEVGARSLRFPG